MSSTSEQNCEVQLAAEIEVLKSALADKHSQLLAMESACLQESDRQVELEDSIIAWQDKYERLYESHKRVQKLNQNLEDKLLKLVDRNSGERAQLTSDVATLSVRLAQANYNIQSLKREIERYKTDISVAIQLLQCKPDSFVSPKLSSLPIEIQSKVASYMRLDTNSHSDSEGSTSGVGMATTSSYHVLPASDSPPPICPFPPTAMVYSMRGLDGNMDPPQSKELQQQSQQQVASNKQANGGSNHHHHLHHQQHGQQQHQQQQQQHQQEATLVPLGSANPNTAHSTDSLLGDARAVAPPNGQGVVSPSVMARFLEDELKAGDALLLGTPIKHCDTCVCTRSGECGGGGGGAGGSNEGSLLLADLLGSEQKYYSVATQTLIRGETNNSLCLRCNSNLNSPSHNNSPYIMKLIKSSDSVISETKSSVSDYLTTPDKVSPTGGSGGNGSGPASSGELLGPPVKKDDLMVNPILGHHRPSVDHSLLLGKPAQVSTPYASAKLVGKKAPGMMTPAAPPPSLTASESYKPSAKSGQPQTSPPAQPASKFAHDSPSYIIKDTDQMSGSQPTPKSSSALGGPGGPGGGGSLASAAAAASTVTGGSKYVGTSASGSVGSGLYHTVGSTNSLWSRTSSKDPEKDGAKMFELFNRNLIKTIKAENPKMCGPRICALRIQNGSSNILLDNLVDDGLDGADLKPPTPVMYTRRAKFLDEELLLDDDPSIGLNGAIKTTNLPTATPTPGELSGTGRSSQELEGQTKSPGNGEAGMVDPSNVPGRGDEDGGVEGVAGKQGCDMSTTTTTTTSPHSSDRLCTIGEEVSNLLINTKLGPARLDPKPSRLVDISVNKLDGLDVTSKKSCTHSSSISSEIDIQESAILRRQQLSRVAEWVQNNSKLGTGAEILSHGESDPEPGPPSRLHATADTLNNNNPPPTVSAVPSKASTAAGQARAAATSHLALGPPGKPTMALGDPKTAAYGRPMGMNNNGLRHNLPYHHAHHHHQQQQQQQQQYTYPYQPQNASSSTFAQPAGPEPTRMAVKHGYNNALHGSMSSGSYAPTSTSTTTGTAAVPSADSNLLRLDYNSNAPATNASSSGAIRKGSYGHRPREGAHTECLLDSVASRRSGGEDDNDDDAVVVDDDDDDGSSSIDLAQMEYNVKQFLLKQNEWSTVHTRRPSLISSTASSVKGRGEREERPVARGLFPGTAVAQTGAPYRGSHQYPINPHRTETNL